MGTLFMRSSRNNLLAGAFVLVAIMTAIVVVVLLGGFLEMIGKHGYLVAFKIEDGVTGLETGSRVLVGGRPVGVVSSLSFEGEEEGKITGVEVVISIDRRITLRQGAVAYLNSPLLGGGATINFPFLGQGADLAADEVIQGRLAPPSLLAQAGYGDEQKNQVQNIIRRVSDAADKIDLFMDDARPIVTDVRTKWPEWSGRFDSITKNVDETTAKGPKIADDLQGRLDELKKMFETAQGYLDENRQNVKETTASFKNIGSEGEKFMTRLNSELADKTASFLDEAKEAFADAQAAVNGIDMLREEQLPNIRRMFANFRLASDQLAATLAEVRRSPWRLLYRPDKRELDFELLYDSARVYAAAVTDLRSASESLQSFTAANPAAANTNPGRVDGLIGDIESAFGKYKEAEAEFLRQIMLYAEPASGKTP